MEMGFEVGAGVTQKTLTLSKLPLTSVRIFWSSLNSEADNVMKANC